MYVIILLSYTGEKKKINSTELLRKTFSINSNIMLPSSRIAGWTRCVRNENDTNYLRWITTAEVWTRKSQHVTSSELEWSTHGIDETLDLIYSVDCALKYIGSCGSQGLKIALKMSRTGGRFRFCSRVDALGILQLRRKNSGRCKSSSCFWFTWSG